MEAEGFTSLGVTAKSTPLSILDAILQHPNSGRGFHSQPTHRADTVFRNMEGIVTAGLYLDVQKRLKDRTPKTRLYRQVRSLSKLFLSSFNGSRETDPVLLLNSHLLEVLKGAGAGVGTGTGAGASGSMLPIGKLLELAILSYSLRNSSADSDKEALLNEEILNGELTRYLSEIIYHQKEEVNHL